MSSEANDNFTRLSLGAIFRKVFDLYVRGFKVLVSLSALTMILTGLIWTILLLFLIPAFEIEADKLSDPNYLLAHIGGFYAILGIYQMVGMVIGAIMSGPMVRAIVDLYMGKQPILKHCLKVGVMRAHAIFCASIVVFFGVLGGCIFLVFPGLYVGVRWFFVCPIIVVEGLGVFASLKRSWNLVNGSWCYVFCTFFSCLIPVSLLTMLWQGLLGMDSTSAIFSIRGTLLTLAPVVLSGPIIPIFSTLMYLNVRIEKEGLNQSELIRNMGDSGALEDAYTPLLDLDDDDVSPFLDEEADLDHV